MKYKTQWLGPQYPTSPFPLQLRLVKSAGNDAPKYNYRDNRYDQTFRDRGIINDNMTPAESWRALLSDDDNYIDHMRYIQEVERKGRAAQELLVRRENILRHFPNEDPPSEEEYKQAKQDYAHWVQFVHDDLKRSINRWHYEDPSTRPYHLQYPHAVMAPWEQSPSYLGGEHTRRGIHDTEWSKDLHEKDGDVSDVIRDLNDSYEQSQEEEPEAEEDDEDYSDYDYDDDNYDNDDEEHEQQRDELRERAEREYNSTPPEDRNKEDSSGSTPWDRYQEGSQDYYNRDLAKVARFLSNSGVEDGIHDAYTLSQNAGNDEINNSGGLIAKFGPYAFSISSSFVPDRDQQRRDERWGIDWESPTPEHGRSRPLIRRGENAPGTGNAYIGSLIQYRDKHEGEKTLSVRSFADQIAQQLHERGMQDVSYSPANSSRTINGKSIGGESRGRLFEAIINAAQKKLKQIHGENLGRNTIVETTRSGKRVTMPSSSTISRQKHFRDEIVRVPGEGAVNVGEAARNETARQMHQLRKEPLEQQVRTTLSRQRDPQVAREMHPVMERSAQPFPLQMRLMKATAKNPMERKVRDDVAKVRDEEEDDAVKRMRQNHRRYVDAVSSAMNDAAKDILEQVRSVESDFGRKIAREERQEESQGIKRHSEAHEKNHGANQHAGKIVNAIQAHRNKERKERLDDMDGWYKEKERYAVQGMRENKKKDINQVIGIVRNIKKDK